MAAGRPMAEVIDLIEAALLGSELGLVIIDRLNLTDAHPDDLMHRGVVVSMPSTANSEQFRDQDLAWVADEIRLDMGYRIRPLEQRVSRNEAFVLEEQIRVEMTRRSLLPDLHLTYAGTPSRAPHPRDATWWIATQTFTAAREAALGGF